MCLDQEVLIQSLTLILCFEHIAKILLALRFDSFVGLAFSALEDALILVPWSSVPTTSFDLCHVLINSHNEFAKTSSYRWPV